MNAATVLGVSLRVGQLVSLSARFERPVMLGCSDHQDLLLRLVGLRLIELGLALLQLFRLVGIEVVP